MLCPNNCQIQGYQSFQGQLIHVQISMLHLSSKWLKLWLKETAKDTEAITRWASKDSSCSRSSKSNSGRID